MELQAAADDLDQLPHRHVVRDQELGANSQNIASQPVHKTADVNNYPFTTVALCTTVPLSCRGRAAVSPPGSAR